MIDHLGTSEMPADHPVEDWEVITLFGLKAMMMLGFALAILSGQVNQLRGNLGHIKGTPAGILAGTAFDAEKERQYEQLKSAWLAVRDERDLNQRLDALQLKMSDSPNWYQVSEEYQRLCEIAHKIFSEGDEGAKRHTVVFLMNATCKQAQLTPKLPLELTAEQKELAIYNELDRQFGEYEGEYALSEDNINTRESKDDEEFDRMQWNSITHPANLRKLAEEIHRQTKRDRERLADLQLDLCLRTMQATPAVPGAVGLGGREVLARDVNEFDKAYRLLPEVKERLLK